MGLRFCKGWAACVLGFGAAALSGCWSVVNVGGPGAGGSGAGGGGGAGGSLPLSKADKVDLLLVVDNSRSMADKQEVLAATFADLVSGIINPPCIDDNGNEVGTPPSPTDPCPVNSERRHAPVTDMHVGVISTSIGGHGADSCPNVDSSGGDCSPLLNYTNNDKGRLLARTDPCTGQQAPTWDNKGFVLWDPGLKYSPGGTTDPAELATTVASVVVGLGQIGCGYESQLESWYRFLADPAPYELISLVNNEAVPQGEDTELLVQRANFLRPDSMLVILTLTDENDCSTKEYGQFYQAGQLRVGSSPFRLPRARQECTTNGPNDVCCFSCAQDPGACPPDPTCTVNGQIALLSQSEDEINVRCWDQKRRFGIDFLYPIDRYVQALTNPMIADRTGMLVPNPIFSDLNPNDDNMTIRDPGLVFMASIAGVPWQDIASDPSDLGAGFKTATELSQSGTWEVILGDPINDIPPTSAYMKESIAPRTGIAPGNPINGGEWTIPNNDLQYACSYPLLTPRDCTNNSLSSCDCQQPTDNPLCAPNPNDGNQPTLQVRAKGYPSTRMLSLIKGLGDQGLLGSICPAQLTDDMPAARDYAYRPAVQSLLKQMATRL